MLVACPRNQHYGPRFSLAIGSALRPTSIPRSPRPVAVHHPAESRFCRGIREAPGAPRLAPRRVPSRRRASSPSASIARGCGHPLSSAARSTIRGFPHWIRGCLADCSWISNRAGRSCMWTAGTSGSWTSSAAITATSISAPVRTRSKSSRPTTSGSATTGRSSLAQPQAVPVAKTIAVTSRLLINLVTVTCRQDDLR